MSAGFVLGFLPLTYLVALIALAVKAKWRVILISLAVFVGTLAVGIVVINQSLDSTAWAGYFLLPAMAGAAALLALAYGFSRTSKRWPVRLLSRVALLAALAIPGSHVVTTWKTNRRIAAARAVEQAKWQAVVAKRESVATMPVDSLNRMVRERMRERDFVLLALKRPDLSPDLLDTLAAESDLDVAQMAVQHPGTRSETLASVYRNATHRQFFYYLLAAQRNTPPDILLAIHQLKPTPASRLDEAFAGNASAPREILDEISRTTTSTQAARSLLANPSIDCQLAKQVAASPGATSGWRSELVRQRALELQAALCR